LVLKTFHSPQSRRGQSAIVSSAIRAHSV
jgi:hypothetical protein